MPSANPAADAAKHRRWYEKHRPAILQRKRDNRRRIAYGVTPERYAEMVAAQDGRCRICLTDRPSSHPSKTHWCVDHCHRTGLVRGLLCDTCNRGIGLLKDCADVLFRAAEYLKEHEDVGHVIH